MAQLEPIDRYFEVMSDSGVYPNAGNLKFYLGYLFEGLSFRGLSMLDVGAGVGLFGLYGAATGARNVVCLEPESAGSTSGVQRKFEELVRTLGLTTASMTAAPLQEYDTGGAQFDVVLLHNSINHLDEPCCIRLQQDEAARGVYRAVLSRLAEMTAPGGRLIVADCSRRNFFGDLGIRNPFAPQIERHKPQSPKLWMGLLADCGFGDLSVRWTSYNTLRTAGRILLGHRPVSYFLQSDFCLTARRVQGRVTP